MSVIATPSPTADSYCSNADAVAIWSADVDKSDYPTDETIQDSVLRKATRQLDQKYGSSYAGQIYDASYSLYWPRTGVIDQRTGRAITDYTVYPDFMIQAVALQAYYLSKGSRTEEAVISTNISETLEGVGSVTRASVSEQKQAAYTSVIHPEVAAIMDQGMGTTASGCMVVLGRG